MVSSISNHTVLVTIISSIILAALLFAALFLYLKNRKKFTPDSMNGLEFEQYCSELLIANGFQNVSVTKASGDYGIDILATKDMITYAIQCKVYSEPVGIKAVQEAYAGRDYYDCMIGAVLTNQHFTKAAQNCAARLKILLWDREYLQKLIDNANSQ